MLAAMRLGITRCSPLAHARRRLCTKSDREFLDFLAERGRALGMPISRETRKLIAAEAERKGGCDGRMPSTDWKRLVSARTEAEQERLTLSEYLLRSHDLHLGQHLLKWTSRLGVSFFALCGAHAAGETGMHVVGATVVGCVTGLGGGTINNVIVGSTPVGWMKDPSILAATIAASVIGFYLWPLAERLLDADATDPAAAGGVPSAAAAGGARLPRGSAEALRYTLETLGLGSLAVVGAQQGIVRGLHPLACVSLGVCVTFGGVMRDLLLAQEVRLAAANGCQSYAAASLAAASVYVALRQAHVWNCAGSCTRLVHGGLPIGLRIALGCGTACAIRLYAWELKGQPGRAELLSSMDGAARDNHERLRAISSAISAGPRGA